MKFLFERVSWRGCRSTWRTSRSGSCSCRFRIFAVSSRNQQVGEFFAQDDNTSGLSTEEMAEVFKNDVELLMNWLMKSRWTRCSHAMIMPRWCRRWVLRTTGPSTAGAAVPAATSTLSAGLSLQLLPKIKMENCLSPAASRCGGPLEERPCPVEGCEETIGGANEQLNASNR